jgi:hypothetical protein
MLEPDLSQHDIPSACVIAQQYSSAIFVLRRHYSRKKKFNGLFKNVNSFLSFFKMA